jgi:hypothetical protein
LLPVEEQILDSVLAEAAGTYSYGADDEWRFDNLLDDVPQRTDDDDAQSGWLDVVRVITLRTVTAGCLAPSVADRAMARAWALDNCPEAVVPAEEWLAAFDVVGFTSDPEEPFEQPAAPAQLWRGATFERRAGLAWTSELDVAERFAEELQKAGLPGLVFTAHVEPDRVKARYNAHGEENEWVIDPRGLEVARA